MMKNIITGHDRLRVHLGQQHLPGTAVHPCVALHPGLRHPAQVQREVLPHQAVPGHVGGAYELSLCRGKDSDG